MTTRHPFKGLAGVFRRNPMIRQGFSIETKKNEAFLLDISIVIVANKKTRSKKLKLISNFNFALEKSYLLKNRKVSKSSNEKFSFEIINIIDIYHE